MPLTKLTALRQRIRAAADNLPGSCAIPFCDLQTMRRSAVGLSEIHCRYHVQFKARHGSHWHRTYKATELKPYLTVAAEWIDEHREDPLVAYPLMGLRGLLEGSGHTERAQDIKRRPAASKARVAFARLREAAIELAQLLTIHIGVGALIEHDRGSHRVEEFRLVQTAKAVHRLASGNHGRYEWPMADGTIRPIETHNYPRSSGIVLRVIGKEIDEICGGVAEIALQDVIAAREEKFGPHPSHLTGWKPLWMEQRDAAKTAVLRK